MKRREFLNRSIPASGLALISPGYIFLQMFSEINHQFSEKSAFEEYDLVINGAGLSGYFAAINSAKKNKKILVVEKRTFPGFDITAKRKLWLGSEGLHDFRPDLMQIFLPEAERPEIQNMDGQDPFLSRFDEEILLFAGSVKKEMSRNMLVNKIHVLLMTDVCGIFSDKENVCGVLLAGKFGLKAVKCRNFIDTSDNVLLTRKLYDDKFRIRKAGFVMELQNVRNPQHKQVRVSEKFGLDGNIIKFHNGKRSDHQLFMEFDFLPGTQELSEVENEARNISTKIGENLAELDDSLMNAKISQFAYECSICLENNSQPIPSLNGYYLLNNEHSQLNCKGILEIENDAKKLVNDIKYFRNNRKTKNLIIAGVEIPVKEILFTDTDDPGLAVPLRNCIFDYQKWVKIKEQCEVLVAGGGTAGAMSAMGAGEKGAETIVVDYFNDLGGTKTMGGVMGYYHGIKDNAFFNKQDEESKRMAVETNSTAGIGRKLYHLKSILDKGIKFIPGAIMCGALFSRGKLDGVLACSNGELFLVQGNVTIDATGDGDIAVFAGANFNHGNSRTGKTQNYSQWDIPGGGKLPSPPSRDYDIIDCTKLSELQRGLFLSHYEAHFYDFYPLLSVRESRRIEGLYELNLIDAAEGTHFEDMISLAKSDFDPHYVGNSEFTRCGFLLPHSNLLTVEIPYRSLVPRNVDGLLISGKAISQTNNAMQFTRMSGDILVLGYLTGQIAADIVRKNLQPREYNITQMQKEWVKTGLFPEDHYFKKTGNLIRDINETRRRVNHLGNGEQEYLYECVRVPEDIILPVLLENFEKSDNEAGKILIAKAMAWFGRAEGTSLIENELIRLFHQELKQGYPGGYIENYDLIRGREKNQLEGLFWRINQDIAILAMGGSEKSNGIIRYILENTSSGGGVIKWTGPRAEYFNERTDLRLIPYHNRILNICFYVERMADPFFIPSIEKLLEDINIKGFVTKEYYLTRWRMYGGDLELRIAAALARCGSKTGYDLLIQYMNDIHYNFKNFSACELKALTGEDYGYDVEAWNRYVKKMHFPQTCKRLIKKVEI